MKWDFFVRHYADETQQRRDPSTCDATAADGVLYPRAGTLGGCTAHNAMIIVYPHNADWDQIAELTRRRRRGARDRMRDVLRAARGLPPPPLRPLPRPARDQPEPPRLGRLASTEKAIPLAALMGDPRADPGDPRVGPRGPSRRPARRSRRSVASLDSRADPNDWRVVSDRRGRDPLHPADHRAPPARGDARARARRASAGTRSGCRSRLHALATRVLFDARQHARSASSISRARAVPRALRGRAPARACCARSGPRGRSSWPAGRSILRSC